MFVMKNGERMGKGMSKLEFTKGPWKVEDAPGAGWQIKATIPRLENYRFNDGGACIWTVPRDTVISATDKPQPLIGYEPWVQFPPKWWIEMARANANLISAAPDMYEACKSMIDALGRLPGGLPDSTFTEPYFRMREALAKAGG